MKLPYVNCTYSVICGSLNNHWFSIGISEIYKDMCHLMFMLNSAEHELYHAHKCENDNNCWHFDIY